MPVRLKTETWLRVVNHADDCCDSSHLSDPLLRPIPSLKPRRNPGGSNTNVKSDRSWVSSLPEEVPSLACSGSRRTIPVCWKAVHSRSVAVLFCNNTKETATRIFEHDEIRAWAVTPWIATCAEVDQALDFGRLV